MGDKTMSLGIDLIHVVGSGKYAELCQSQDVTRAYDVKDSIVMKWHVEHCKLTVERAQAILNLVSAYNHKNPTSKQIECSFGVCVGDVTMFVNGVQYSQADFADVCYHIRRLGVKVPIIFSTIVEG